MSKTTQQNLNVAIEKAIEKVHGDTEKDIYRFIPGTREGYIHHFTFKKLKEREPERCLALLEEFILGPVKPRELDAPSRAPRESNRGDSLSSKFKNEMLSRMIHLAREVGDDTTLSKLMAFRPLKQIKRDLIRSIRAEKANQELWEAYREAVLASQESE